LGFQIPDEFQPNPDHIQSVSVEGVRKIKARLKISKDTLRLEIIEEKSSIPGFKIRQTFFGAERSGGAEISENFDFLVFFMKFSRKISQKGPKHSHITPDALAR
jgi:hypothetical protein